MKQKWSNRFPVTNNAKGYEKLRAAIEALNSQTMFESHFGQAEPTKPKLKLRKISRRWYYLDNRALQHPLQLLALFTHPYSRN